MEPLLSRHVVQPLCCQHFQDAERFQQIRRFVQAEMAEWQEQRVRALEEQLCAERRERERVAERLLAAQQQCALEQRRAADLQRALASAQEENSLLAGTLPAEKMTAEAVVSATLNEVCRQMQQQQQQLEESMELPPISLEEQMELQDMVEPMQKLAQELLQMSGEPGGAEYSEETKQQQQQQQEEEEMKQQEKELQQQEELQQVLAMELESIQVEELRQHQQLEELKQQLEGRRGGGGAVAVAAVAASAAAATTSVGVAVGGGGGYRGLEGVLEGHELPATMIQLDVQQQLKELSELAAQIPGASSSPSMQLLQQLDAVQADLKQQQMKMQMQALHILPQPQQPKQYQRQQQLKFQAGAKHQLQQQVQMQLQMAVPKRQRNLDHEEDIEAQGAMPSLKKERSEDSRDSDNMHERHHKHPQHHPSQQWQHHQQQAELHHPLPEQQHLPSSDTHSQLSSPLQTLKTEFLPPPLPIPEPKTSTTFATAAPLPVFTNLPRLTTLISPPAPTLLSSPTRSTLMDSIIGPEIPLPPLTLNLQQRHLPEPPEADRTVLLRSLPSQGKLLKAVEEAGPLLDEVMRARPLPQFRQNPKPPEKDAVLLTMPGLQLPMPAMTSTLSSSSSSSLRGHVAAPQGGGTGGGGALSGSLLGGGHVSPTLGSPGTLKSAARRGGWPPSPQLGGRGAMGRGHVAHSHVSQAVSVLRPLEFGAMQ